MVSQKILILHLVNGKRILKKEEKHLIILNDRRECWVIQQTVTDTFQKEVKPKQQFAEKTHSKDEVWKHVKWKLWRTKNYGRNNLIVIAMLHIEGYSCRIVSTEMTDYWKTFPCTTQSKDIISWKGLISQLSQSCSYHGCLCNIFYIFFLPLNFLLKFYTQHSL